MAEETLVDSRIPDTITLIKALDAGADFLTLAAWYYYDDAGEWRLLIAGPAFDTMLPKQEPLVYQRIVATITTAKLTNLLISQIKPVRSDSPLPQAIRVLISTGDKGISQVYFSAVSLNNIFIKEMIVLRSG